MSAAEELAPDAVTITRFRSLTDRTARGTDTTWTDLFAEFSCCVPFSGDRHPGWAAAEFDPPQRALAKVKRVFALVLDFDNKGPDGHLVEQPDALEGIAEGLKGYRAFLHTTRSHTDDWPRFRVILPFSRPVTAEEYARVWAGAARRWPGVDPAPKDPSRFWFTPGIGSHAGAEFKPLELPGRYLDPDELLTVPAPLCVAVEPSNTNGATQETRARAYIGTMPPAISGAGGHHALFNVACVLVHGFGLDEQSAFRIIKSGYNHRCVPLWSDKDIQYKVTQAATKARVKNPIQDRPREADTIEVHDVEVVAKPSAPVVSEAWKKDLRYDMNGQVMKEVGNAGLIMKSAEGFAGCLAFDIMAHRAYWYASPAFQVGYTVPQAGEALADHHIVYVQHVLSKRFNIPVGKDIAWSALEAAAHESRRHPVQDYLSPLVWDGTQRLSKWLSRYLGAADNEYTNAVGRWWLISAVARAIKPGCQADHVLILEGGQGLARGTGFADLSS